jgi:hypothetical protein
MSCLTRLSGCLVGFLFWGNPRIKPPLHELPLLEDWKRLNIFNQLGQQLHQLEYRQSFLLL